MHSRTWTRWFVAVLLLGSGAGPASAQGEGRPPRNLGSMVNVDALLDNYLRVLARKYDLSEEQAAFTEEFVRQRVDQFLDRHQAELGGLVDRLFEVRTGGDMSQQELQEWGRRVLPIYNEAKVFIVEANSQWRQILSDQQRAIHDEDLRQMNESFVTTEDQLQRLVTGQMTVEEFRHPQAPSRTRAAHVAANPAAPPVVSPAPTPAVTPTAAPTAATPSASRGPSAPARPGGGPSAARVSTPNPGAAPEAGHPTSDGRSGRTMTSMREGRGGHGGPGVSPGGGAEGTESQWETYVREFVTRYQLNDEQKESAYKILKSCQERANQYMRSHKTDLEQLDRRSAQLLGSKQSNAAKELADIAMRRAKLLEPIQQIFDKDLKPRLDKLPTRAQREAATKAPATPAGPGTSGREGGRRGGPTPSTAPPEPEPPSGGP